MHNIYLRLARHLEDLIMGYPFNEALIDLLEAMYRPVEAEVALAIPNNLQPLEIIDRQTIVDRCDLPESTVDEALQSLSGRNMLYTRTTEAGETGYALLRYSKSINTMKQYPHGHWDALSQNNRFPIAEQRKVVQKIKCSVMGCCAHHFLITISG